MTKDNTRCFFHWESVVTIITIIVNILLIALFIHAVCSDNLFNQIFVLIILIGAALFVPICLSLNSESLKIRRPIGKICIRLQDIKLCYEVNRNDLDDYVRTFGSGGAYGLLGNFKHHKYGKVRFFVTDRNQCFIVRTKDGRNYMISSPLRDEIIKMINKNLD